MFPHKATKQQQKEHNLLFLVTGLPRILEGTEELPDEAVVTGDSVTFLQREPPMILCRSWVTFYIFKGT